MHKTRFVFPIIGARKVEQLQDNIEALDIALTKEHIDYLESILPFDKGFPTSFIVSPIWVHIRVVKPANPDFLILG